MPSQWSQEKYVAALKYAGAAHSGQKVPGSDLPYVVHEVMVAMEVIGALQVEGGIDGDLAVQCALLHDVIEDAGRSYEDLEKVFGKNVADGVLALTKSNLIEKKTATCGNRERPQHQRARNYANGPLHRNAPWGVVQTWTLTGGLFESSVRKAAQIRPSR